MKQCTRCKRSFPVGEFPVKQGRNRKPVVRSWCHDCCRAYARDYRQKNPPELKRYGLTREEFEQLGDNCRICGASRQDTRMCVDHCHTTQKVRGLLCHNCNAGLGHFRDNVSLLQQAILYLAENQ